MFWGFLVAVFCFFFFFQAEDGIRDWSVTGVQTCALPISEDELSAQGWTSETMASDSRILLHYFRLMPDRRFQIGRASCRERV